MKLRSSVTLKPETHYRLNLLKVLERFRTLDDLINFLLGFYEQHKVKGDKLPKLLQNKQNRKVYKPY